MSDEPPKLGETVAAFSPDLSKLPEGASDDALPRPTHYPEGRTITLYGIEVGENGDMPFFAHPVPFKNILN